MALPFIFLRLLWRSRNAPDYRRRWAERLGFCPFRLQQSIWVHSVSVGETIAAIPLIKALLERYPQYPLLVTTMTPTGAARVKAAFADRVQHAYIPYDLPGAVKRFLNRVDPQILVIMETEIWPNLLAACRKRQIPIVLTNARLSAKSAAGYQRIAPLTRTMLAEIQQLAAQAQADADRFIALGMSKERVTVTGNIKFDIAIAEDLIARSEVLRHQLGKSRPVWIAASTHEGEEDIILDAHRQVLAKFPESLLILVPRHPERFTQIAQLAQQKKFMVARRSENTTCTPATSIYLGDTMGELMLLYAVSDVAFVAGSFAKVGGHNLLEPAVLGKPVISGPQLFNFAAISEMLASSQALTIVTDANQLAQAVTRFFAETRLQQQMGDRARKVVEANRGALARQLAVICPLVEG